MGFQDGLAHSLSTSALPTAYDQLGYADSAFDTAKLIGGPLSSRFSMKSPDAFVYDKLMHGGSPVLAWRRQHRPSKTVGKVLPPLRRNVRDEQDLSSDLVVPQPWGSKLRHSSTPPGLGKAQSLLEPLCPRQREAPLAARLSKPPSQEEVQPPQAQQLPAMVLDLMPETQQEVEDMQVSIVEKATIEEELLLPCEPVDSMEQHWFPLMELEGQVRQWRSQVPAPKPILSCDPEECQEFSADGDDAESMLSHLPFTRVRPGEYLEFEECGEWEMNYADEDIGELMACNAIDDGLHRFLTEVMMDDGEWTDQEEV